MAAASKPAEPPTQRDDTNVVALLRSGGAPRQAAMSQLFTRYAGDFMRFFRRHGLTPEAAEDIVQETFVRVVRAIDNYRPEGSLEAWLWTIARNTLMTHLRERKMVSLDALATSDDALDLGDLLAGGSNPAAADCLKRTFDSFARAHPEDAESLVRIVADGWGYAELAQFRQSGEGATREYLSQCRKRLLEFVQPCFEFAEGR